MNVVVTDLRFFAAPDREQFEASVLCVSQPLPV
jgi:hypothetical protein